MPLDLRFSFFSKTHIFNNHAPIKEKYLRANEPPFMTNELYITVMKRLRLRIKILREKNQANRDNYKILRNPRKNFCEKPKTQIIAILIEKNHG